MYKRQAYNKALSLKPDLAEAHNNMGNALKNQGKLEAAIEAYKKALTLKPDYLAAHNNMGNAFKDQGKLEEAIEAYNKALSLKLKRQCFVVSLYCFLQLTLIFESIAHVVMGR